MNNVTYIFLFIVSGILINRPSSAQFVDHFGDPENQNQGLSPEAWSTASGDGDVSIEFIQKKEYASIHVYATRDKRNIWWAVIRRQIPGLDLNTLSKPGYELRVETRIKVSHAPRRINLHFNHQRTTDFHSHLMEYDIPDTTDWHTISMTTKNFDGRPGDKINAQLALMDWGKGEYRVDIDYFKVDVVNTNDVGEDLGAKLPYHPPVADPETFAYHIKVIEDAMIDTEYRDMNFNNWEKNNGNDKTTLLTVSGTQMVLLRWDFNDFKGKKVKGAGLLELTTNTLQRSPDYQKDFGMVRVTEILGGEVDWDQGEVTYNSFCNNQPLDRVLNPQMIIDYPVKAERGQKSLFTISEPALQRLIDGKTRGLAIRPLGAVIASFYAMENGDGKFSPVLHINFEAGSEGK